MKPSVLTILLALSVCLGFGCASTPVSERNRIGRAEAIKIASQLSVGTREEDALHFLFHNGFTMDNVPGVGGSFGWSHQFYLSDGSRLDLYFRPKPMRPDGVWANGRLSAAYIQRNWGAMIPIKLADAP